METSQVDLHSQVGPRCTAELVGHLVCLTILLGGLKVDGKNYSFAPNFDFMFTLHFIASYELECNRHQFFHVVHHITCIQNFYIHREFFLSKIHQVT